MSTYQLHVHLVSSHLSLQNTYFYFLHLLIHFSRKLVHTHDLVFSIHLYCVGIIYFYTYILQKRHHFLSGQQEHYIIHTGFDAYVTRRLAKIKCRFYITSSWIWPII